MHTASIDSALYRDIALALAGQHVVLAKYRADDLLGMAQANGVTTMLAHWLSVGSHSDIDNSTAKVINDIAKARAAQDLALSHDTRKILALFAKNGLRCLLLKGTPISMLAYPRSYLRTRCDTDLYISIEDVDKISSVLREADFSVHGLNARPLASKQFQASWFTQGRSRSTFDIHYRLSNRTFFSNTLPFEECWTERQPVPALGPNAWALSNRDLLLHACIHRIAHGRGTERNRLIWLYDIHLLWNAMDEAEREAFIDKALEKKIGAVCDDALQVCDELFRTVGGASAATEEAQTRQSPLTRLLQNQQNEPTARLVNAGKLRWAWTDVMATPGIGRKIAFMKELVLKR